MRKEALYNQIKESGTAIQRFLNNPLYRPLKRACNVGSRVFQPIRTFTPDFPKMKNLKSQIDTISANLNLKSPVS